MTAVLAEPAPTPFDLRWRMLGTDIRISPWFWVVTPLLGWGFFQEGGIGYLVLWVVCVLVSILLHEFGHVMMGRLFGSNSHIVLTGFGGLAVGITVWKRWQRILVSFAGPAIQLVLFVLLLVVAPLILQVTPDNYARVVGALLTMLLLINLFWPLLNLLPVWPLDGGQIARELFEAVWKERGFAYALLVSGIVAAVLALHCLMASRGQPLIWFLPIGGMYTGIFFALFAVNSFQMWAQVKDQYRRPPPEVDDRLPWER
jgi:Zn-dependent protease